MLKKGGQKVPRKQISARRRKEEETKRNNKTKDWVITEENDYLLPQKDNIPAEEDPRFLLNPEDEPVDTLDYVETIDESMIEIDLDPDQNETGNDADDECCED